MASQKPNFVEGKPAEAVSRAVERLVELTRQVAQLHDTGARLREQIASHLRRLDQERARADQLASGRVPARQDGVPAQRPENEST